jgi:mannitol-specific phosphotransferase system IIBC component
MVNILLGFFDLGADMGMIVGPCAGYLVQIRKMHKEKVSEGFSTYVSFILILSNLIRIFWW